MEMLIKSQLQYTSSFIMATLSQLVMEGGEILAVILIIDRFENLGHWTGGNLFFFFARTVLILEALFLKTAL